MGGFKKPSGASLGTATPVAVGTAAVGVSANASHDDHVHPLNTIAGHLVSDVTLAANGDTNIITTPSLGVGTWEVEFVVTLQSGSATSQVLSPTVIVGTATATFDGAQSSSLATGALAGGVTWGNVVLKVRVVVTVAGTLILKANNNNTTNTAFAKATNSPAVANATGYTAKQVA